MFWDLKMDIKHILDKRALYQHRYNTQQVTKNAQNIRLKTCASDVFRTLEEDHAGKVKGAGN